MFSAKKVVKNGLFRYPAGLINRGCNFIGRWVLRQGVFALDGGMEQLKILENQCKSG